MRKDNLEIRYMPELTVWRQIQESGGGKLTLETNGKAIHTVLRLNSVRKALRLRDGETDLDFFVVALKKGDTTIVVQPRQMIDAQFEPLTQDLELETEE